MTQNNLEIIEGFPANVKRVYDTAFTLANRELKLHVVDSSVVLLAIIKLGDGNSSARWLHSTGLTSTATQRFIMEDFTSHEEDNQVKNCQNNHRPIPVSAICTQPIIKTLRYLRGLSEKSRTNGGPHVAHILEAITYSGSPTVERIFCSVGLGMIDVRSKLNVPSITDLKKLHARRN